MFFRIPRNSLYFRLFAWYFISLGLAILIFGLLIYFYTANYVWQELDERLLADSENVAEIVSKMYQDVLNMPLPQRHGELKKEFSDWIRKKNREAGFFNKFIVISNASKQALAASKKIPEPGIFIDRLNSDFAPGGYQYYSFFKKPDFYMRIITYPYYENRKLKFYLQIGYSSFKERLFLRRLRTSLWLLFPVVFFLSLVGLVFLRRALKPFYQMISHMQVVDPEAIKEVEIDTKGNYELNLLVENYNAMLGRLKQNYERLKELSVDISHQLRTPLTILQGEIETILSKPRPEAEYQEVLQSNLEEVKGLIQTIEKLLLLGKLRSQTYFEEEAVFNLNDLLASIFTRFRSQIKQKELSYDIGAVERIKVKADQFLLRNLFLNLIDNAVKYSAQGSHISCRLREEKDSIVVSLTNTPEADLTQEMEKLLKRYHQGTASASSAGLGLSIAGEIVKYYDGKIEPALTYEQKIEVVVNLCLPPPD